MSTPRELDVTRILGRGRACLDRASAGLFSWEMHRRAGIHVTADGPAVPGERVVLRPTRGAPGLLLLRCPCEVTWAVEQRNRRGFTYRTLPGHPERGEETFEVRIGADDTVHARIWATSSPGSRLVRLAGPLAEMEQDRITGRYLDALRDIAAGR